MLTSGWAPVRKLSRRDAFRLTGIFVLGAFAQAAIAVGYAMPFGGFRSVVWACALTACLLVAVLASFAWGRPQKIQVVALSSTYATVAYVLVIHPAIFTWYAVVHGGSFGSAEAYVQWYYVRVFTLFMLGEAVAVFFGCMIISAFATRLVSRVTSRYGGAPDTSSATGAASNATVASTASIASTASTADSGA